MYEQPALTPRIEERNRHIQKIARDLAIKTNTSILVSIDGKDVELAAADLIKMREDEIHEPHQ